MLQNCRLLVPLAGSGDPGGSSGRPRDSECGPSAVAAFLLINRLALDRNSNCRHWGSFLPSYLALLLWSCVYLRLQNNNEENNLAFSFIGIIQSFSNSLGPTAIQVCPHLYPGSPHLSLTFPYSVPSAGIDLPRSFAPRSFSSTHLKPNTDPPPSRGFSKPSPLGMTASCHRACCWG